MAYTETDICNLTLARLEAEPLTDMDADTGRNADECRRWFDHVRNEVLRMANWTCALARAELATPDPEPENLTSYTYQFARPTDAIRIISVDGGQKYLQEGDVIYSNTEEPVVRYVSLLTDPTDWDDLLRSAIVLRLGMMIAPKITGKRELVRELGAEFAPILTEARGQSGDERGEAPEAVTLWAKEY